MPELLCSWLGVVAFTTAGDQLAAGLTVVDWLGFSATAVLVVALQPTLGHQGPARSTTASSLCSGLVAPAIS